MALAIRNYIPLQKGDAAVDEDAKIAFALQRKVACPQLYLQMLGGDAKAAVFLAQVEYWQGITTDPDGWFYHTERDWEDELQYSLYEVNRCVKVLAVYGMEFKKAKVDGAPRMHFRVKRETLKNLILKFIKNPGTDSDDEELDNQGTSETKPKELQKPNRRNFRIIQTKNTSKSSDIDPDAHASEGGVANAPTTPSVKNENEQIKKPRYPVPKEDDEDYRRAAYIYRRIKGYAGTTKRFPADDSPKALAKWTRDVHLLVTNDKRTTENIKAIVDYIAAKPCKWRGFVFSPDGLRNWYDAIDQDQQWRQYLDAKRTTVSSRQSATKAGAGSPDAWRHHRENAQRVGGGGSTPTESTAPPESAGPGGGGQTAESEYDELHRLGLV